MSASGTPECAFCRRRTPLLSFTCKCEWSFCVKHRMPEDHACVFDHKACGRSNILLNNPRIQRQKMEPI